MAESAPRGCYRIGVKLVWFTLVQRTTLRRLRRSPRCTTIVGAAVLTAGVGGPLAVTSRPRLRPTPGAARRRETFNEAFMMGAVEQPVAPDHVTLPEEHSQRPENHRQHRTEQYREHGRVSQHRLVVTCRAGLDTGTRGQAPPDDERRQIDHCRHGGSGCRGRPRWQVPPAAGFAAHAAGGFGPPASGMVRSNSHGSERSAARPERGPRPATRAAGARLSQ